MASELSGLWPEDMLKPRAITRRSDPPVADPLFDEFPCTLTEFVQSPVYLGNPALSAIQYDAVLHAERIYWPATYEYLARVAPEEDREYWGTYVRPVSFLTYQWGKGCIAPDEEIYDAASGQWVRIADAPELTVAGTMEAEPDGDTSHCHLQSCLASQERVTARTAGRPFRRGSGRMLKVTTATGIVNTVYEGHLYASWAAHDLPYKNRYRKAVPAWRAAGSLKQGERIAVLSRLPCLNPVSWPDLREVELAGYWIGDGSMPVPGSTQWGLYVDSGPSGAELLARYASLVESYPGITVKTDIMDSGALRVRATGSKSQPSRALTDVVRKLGLYGSRAWDKRVPPAFFSLPDDQLAVFLSAMTDTDGSLYLKQGRHGKCTPHFEYATASEGLARDIQRLLYRFGVVSRVSSRIPKYTYKGKRREGRPSWRVIVASGVYMQRLAAVLRLHGEREWLRLRFLDWSWGKLQQVPEGDIYWDTVKSVEEAGDGDYWDVQVPDTGSYVAGSGPLLSSNSGKDHVSRIAVLRVCYLLVCLRSPQVYYEMPAQDSIHVLNVASNSRQATRAFFNPMRRAVTRESNWFQTMGKVEVMEKQARGRPEKKKEGEGTTALLDTIRFPKNIEAVSGHSDADSQEGLNLIMGVADEIDAFHTSAELEKTTGRRGVRESSTTAEAVLTMLQTSASTRFPELYKNIRISWPRYLGSTIQKLTREGKQDIEEHGEESRHYVSGPYATWEVNPRVKGKWQFAKDYRDDPLMAQARYECKPTYTSNPYFSNEDAVRACTTRPAQPVSVDYARDGKAWKPVYQFAPELYPVRGARYAMHADLALNTCRAGIALAHVRTWQDVTAMGSDQEGLDVTFTETRPVVKVDFVIGYEADKSAVPSREIQIRWAGDLLFELKRRGFVISLFTADQWQSLDLKQRLEVAGIETDRFSLDRDDSGWKNLRDLAYESRLEYPDWELATKEILALTRLPNGKIDHLADGNKDLADAIAGACAGAIRLGGQEDGAGTRAYPGGDVLPWGGRADRTMLPIGMPDMTYLISQDPIPEDIKDREMDYILPGGGTLYDTGEVPDRMT